jgi:hypothetical protein
MAVYFLEDTAMNWPLNAIWIRTVLIVYSPLQFSIIRDGVTTTTKAH